MARLLYLASATLLLAASAAATPLFLPIVSRATKLRDIGSDYASEFKGASSCPDSLKISNAAQDLSLKNAVTVKSADIVENEKQCPADQPPITLLNEGNFRRNDILAGLKLTSVIEGLQKNRNAREIFAQKRGNKTTAMFVGFSDKARSCGSNKYDATTFYFFVKEDFPVPIVTKDADGKTQAITIPPKKRGLVIVDASDRICVLADQSTGDNAPVDVNNETAAARPAATPAALPVTAPVSDSTAGENITGGEESPAPDAPNGGGLPLSADNATEPSGGGSVCFPGSATVELASGKRATMADLRIGDRVRTGPTTFSDVFLFTHRDAAVHEQFVRLVTAAGPAVTLTKSHYLYANGALVAAGAVKSGDVLALADGESSAVAAVENVSADGLYNPQTVDGNIVVDGVVASAYTTAVHPRVAHGALLAPVRFLYARSRASVAVLDALAAFISGSADALARIVPGGPGMMA